MKYILISVVIVITFFVGLFAYDPFLKMTMNSSPGRSLSTTGTNNTFTISSARCSAVYYTINFSVALTLTTSNGKVTLDISTDGGSTWTTLSSVSQVFGTSITITTNQDMILSAMIPANALVRINRTNNSNVTVALGSQEECSM